MENIKKGYLYEKQIKNYIINTLNKQGFYGHKLQKNYY